MDNKIAFIVLGIGVVAGAAINPVLGLMALAVVGFVAFTAR
jgi:hypothetical protein